MKKILNCFPLLFTSLLCCLFCESCSGGDSDEPTVGPIEKPTTKPDITIDADIISNGVTISDNGGNQSITFTCNEDWTLDIKDISRATDWCIASATSGSKGTATIYFTIKENNTDKDRIASITIKSGTTSKTFTIKQEGRKTDTEKEESTHEDKLEVDKSSYDIPTKGETIVLSFATNTAWTISSDQTWCKLSANSGNGGKQNVHITIAANQEKTDRIAVVTIKAGSITREVKIQQFRLESIFIEKPLYEINANGGSLVVNVNSNTEYNIHFSGNWMKLDNQGNNNITFNIAQNNQKETREAVVKLSGKYLDTSFTIRQFKKYEEAENGEAEGSGSDFTKG